MGNEQSQGAEDAAVQHHMFYKRNLNRYIALHNLEAHVTGLGGMHCRFLFNGQLDGPAAPLRVCGLSDEDDRCISVSDNRNIVCLPSADIGSRWRLVGRGKDEHGEQLVAFESEKYPNCYLNCVSKGELRLLDGAANDSCVFVHRIESVTEKKHLKMRKFASWMPNAGSTDLRDYPSSCLSPEQIQQFHRDGYVVLSNSIPPERLEEAIRFIQTGVEQGIDRKKFLGMDHQRWTKAYRQAPEIVGLVTKTPLLKCCEALMDGAAVVEPREGQIALRKPTETGKDFALDLDWHIDAYEKITAARFSVLVVVALSSWTEDNMGNFTVYPGSHVKVGQMMKEQSWSEWNKTVKNSVDLGIERRQIHAHKGDVILAHPLLAHDVAPNQSQQVRWATIYRIHLKEQRKLRSNLLEPTGNVPQMEK